MDEVPPNQIYRDGIRYGILMQVDMIHQSVIYGIGFLAQIFFSARTLVQWIRSEQSGAVVSPASYWLLSVAGSWLFFVYGWLRDDFAIIFGQFVSYYVYLWNLGWKGIWRNIPVPLKAVLVITPVVASAIVLVGDPSNAVRFFLNEDIPLRLLVFGSAGQILFSLRFVYQWICSVRRNESVLPAGFWIISLTGSAAIVVYGILRLDPVLIAGQVFGLAAYSRNLMIAVRSNRFEKPESDEN